jgi:hypothetical protein
MVNSMTQLSDPAPPQQSAQSPLVMSYLTQRLLIGLLAVLLPVVVVIVNWFIGHGVEPSVSGYYYTPMRNIFVGTLCAIGVFLLSYDGYDLPDRLITDLAGLCSICISFFPTVPGSGATAHQVLIGDIHLGFAGGAFVALAVMSFRFAKREPTPAGLPPWERIKYAFGFTKPGLSSTPAWELLTYRLAGLVIVLCIILAYLLSSIQYSLLVIEWVMLSAFGAAWFVKGKKILSGG